MDVIKLLHILNRRRLMTEQLQEEEKPTPAVDEPSPAEEEPTTAEEKLTPAEEKKPALTVIIQSWWTPALAVFALVVGLLLGYFGRPLLNKSADTSGDVAAATAPIVTESANLPVQPTVEVDPTLAAINSQEQLMAYLVSNTTHFKGDPNAAVTIIEFSDYQ
jgi:hypothetical protein